MRDKTLWNSKLIQLLFGCTLLLVTVLVGCKSETPEPTDAFVSPLESSLATTSSVLATPTQSDVVKVVEEVVELLPTSVEGMATVGGTINLDVEGETLRPMPNVRVFLGDVHVSADGENQIAGYSERTSPQSITDAQGHFVIQNVPPGTYNLIVVRYLSPVFMNDHQTKESIVFTLEVGDVLDLGDLHYIATE